MLFMILNLGASMALIGKLRRATTKGATGGISGRVTINNSAAARRVSIFDARSKFLAAEVWSDSAGNYKAGGLTIGREYFVLSFDHDRAYNAVVQDMVIAEAYV